MFHLLFLAAKIAVPTDQSDPRNFWLGSIGIRKDGTLVSARNGAVFSTSHPADKYRTIPDAHAEVRCLRKLGKGGTLFVSRVLRENHSLAMARPCDKCQIFLRSAKVEKVYYSINSDQYGVWWPEKDVDRVFHKKLTYQFKEL